MAAKKDIEKAVNYDEPIQEVVKKVALIESRKAKPDDAQRSLAIDGESQLLVFKGKEIRQVFHKNEWYFSAVDVIEAITESGRPRQYWNDLKRQLSEDEGFVELSEKIEQLKLPSSDGKLYATDCVNVETLFRLVQSIRSPKAEPFKRWLAKVGYERIQEFQNPEVAVKRAIINWQVQGRSTDWIEARLRSIVVRHELTSEWSRRGVNEGMEFGYLTNIISKQTFGLKTEEHKKFKGLKSQNLRDHMTDLELVLTMLGEKSTTAIAQSMDAYGLGENAEAAYSGGKVAGDARKGLESKLGHSVVSPQSFLKAKPQKSLPTAK